MRRLKARNPDIVYSCISGFGHSGPYKDLPGYDIVGQAMGGIMSITGWPESPPTRTGTAIADVLAGLIACIGILDQPARRPQRQAGSKGRYCPGGFGGFGHGNYYSNISG